MHKKKSGNKLPLFFTAIINPLIYATTSLFCYLYILAMFNKNNTIPKNPEKNSIIYN